MSFFMRAAVLALQEYPVVNSVIDGNEIVRRNFVDISLAVATPTGLMVPVLRDCQNKKFHELELVFFYVIAGKLVRKREKWKRLWGNFHLKLFVRITFPFLWLNIIINMIFCS